MAEVSPIYVVGAGQAGVQTVDSLRRGGYEGPLVLVGDEATLPYQRPPLSKDYLGGGMVEERLLFRPSDYYAKQHVDVILETRVTAIDTAARTIAFDGRTHAYAKLALTTGATVRRLPVPGADLPGVFYLRSVEDARILRERLAGPKHRVVAIGGGFIGLEVAASARELGHAVTVVETLERLMARAVSAPISDYYRDLHAGHGVRLMLGCGVDAIESGVEGQLGVVLSDGNTVTADTVVVGIGSVPHTDIASAAGLRCDNGIVVDEHALTSDPQIVAAGDCTSHRNLRYAGYRRLESVQNAVDQAKVAAATLIGQSAAYDQVPWFWSDQYDAKLQMAGTSTDHDACVTRGDAAAGAFSLFYYKDNRFVGADSVNRPGDHVIARRLLAAGVEVPRDIVADVTQNLKALL